MTNLTENKSSTNHQEWLKEVVGQAIPEITQAKAMEGFSDIDLSSLIVANPDLLWDKIKQSIIPLEPASDPETAGQTPRKLKMLRAELMANEAFFVLVKDEAMGGEDNWALSMIRPKDLDVDKDRLRGGMEACYMANEIVLGSASRAAYLAVTGEESIQT